MLKVNSKILSLLAVVLFMTGCELRQSMHNQPKMKDYRESDFFDDKRSARPLVDGTVPRGTLKEDNAYFTGKKDKKDVHIFPIKVTKEVLQRGQERYQIYCLPCHGYTGAGDGMVVQRGFKAPTSYHTDALRNAPVGHFFDVITNGWGQMPNYASQIPTSDRWAIAAYIKVLQLSQNYKYDSLSTEEKALVEGKKKEEPAHGNHHE